MILLRFFFSLLFCAHTSSTALARDLSNLHKVRLPTPATLASKTLGTEIAISGSTAAVAAFSSDETVAGTVYLYDAQESWRLIAEVNSQHRSDDFAKKIILDNKLLIVSAERDDSRGINSGAVYIFEHISASYPQRWQQTAKIIATDTQAGDRFGSSITLKEDILYIGAPLHGQGKIYIYRRDAENRWQLTDSIQPIDPQASRFGTAISQDGISLIIGAPYTDTPNSSTLTKQPNQGFAISKGDVIDPGIESGAIYVYQRTSGHWQQTARLSSTNLETADHLGENIALEGDIIAASIKHKDVFDHLRAGVVYVYKRVENEWQEDSALVASKPNVGANFGNSFSLLNGQIVVGANKVHANGFNSGQVYLFSRDSSGTWTLIHQQANANLKAHSQLGISVAFSSKYILAASRHGVFAFQDTPVDYQPAIFYSDTHTLQLNEVLTTETGVLAASLHLSQLADTSILSVTDYHLRTDINTSNIRYSSTTSHLTVPRLAVQTNTGKLAFYTLVLQQIENQASIQFKVLSLTPL